MQPINPASSVITEQLTRIRRGCYSDMEQLASRGAESSVSGGGNISGWIHKIAACSLPAW